MSGFPDPRVTARLLVPSAPALDVAGAKAGYEFEPARPRVMRVLLCAAVVAELVGLRAMLPADASRGLVDGLIVTAGAMGGLSALSTLPWLRWLDDRRPRRSADREERIGLLVRRGVVLAGIQVYVVASLLLRDTPQPQWIFAGIAVMVVLTIVLSWALGRIPAGRREKVGVR